MHLKDTPIQKKLMRVIRWISGAVLFLTCASYFAYEFVTFRHTTVRQLATLGEIIASNSTAALAFESSDDAYEILSAVKADPHIVVAGIYDKNGKLFSHYPDKLTNHVLPDEPAEDGHQFRQSHLISYQPILQGNKRLGTLYLKSDMKAMYDRLLLYSSIAVIVIVLAFGLTYLLSKNLERQISAPILELARTARSISEHQDYSARATKQGEDEIGLLTDAFNHMLGRIEKQTVDLNESEARVRAVIDAAQSAVIVIDATGAIIDWNVRAETIFGWSHTEVLGRDMAQLIIPDIFRERHHKGLSHFLSTGEGPVLNRMLEMSALRRDGSEFPIELSISPLKNNGVITFCGFITDITLRKQAEEEIKSFNQKLEQKILERTKDLELANKELEAFSYSVSHDLRAPLRSIHGYMTIFAEEYSEKLDDEGIRLMNVVLRNSQKMGQLIDDLLTFSQLGRKELMKGKVSMKKLIDTVWLEYRKMEGDREIQLLLKDLPDAYSDIVTIRQVWINLISNALKYTRHKEKAIIEIGSEEGEDSVTYYVKDNGAGFDMQYYSKLFGVFQRLHSLEQFEGTGVGLAIVHRIISKHSGKVWAEAKPDQGATFYFSLAKEAQT
jgi:PAS domain S-box-containing protein